MRESNAEARSPSDDETELPEAPALPTASGGRPVPAGMMRADGLYSGHGPMLYADLDFDAWVAAIRSTGKPKRSSKPNE